MKLAFFSNRRETVPLKQDNVGNGANKEVVEKQPIDTNVKEDKSFFKWSLRNQMIDRLRYGASCGSCSGAR